MNIAELRVALEDIADPSKVEQMTAYMKGQFEFLGVVSPDRRLVSKPMNKAARAMAPDELLSLADDLFAEAEREFHYVAIEALRAGAKNLRASDLPRIRQYIEQTHWWDTVDSLAVHTVGPMVANHPELLADMDMWIEDENIWISRTAILHQLMYKERTDANRLFTYCEMQIEHTEFFIRKAIGWALRQYARTDAQAVIDFVKAHEGSISGLSKREALKHL